MRRLIAFLIALAFVGVSLTSPAMAMPAETASHQTHCGDRQMMPTDHHKAPTKPMDTQKCCFSALPAVSVAEPVGEISREVLPRTAAVHVDELALAGMNWTADPPPPRHG